MWLGMSIEDVYHIIDASSQIAANDMYLSVANLGFPKSSAAKPAKVHECAVTTKDIIRILYLNWDLARVRHHLWKNTTLLTIYENDLYNL